LHLPEITRCCFDYLLRSFLYIRASHSSAVTPPHHYHRPYRVILPTSWYDPSLNLSLQAPHGKRVILCVHTLEWELLFLSLFRREGLTHSSWSRVELMLISSLYITQTIYWVITYIIILILFSTIFFLKKLMIIECGTVDIRWLLLLTKIHCGLLGLLLLLDSRWGVIDLLYLINRLVKVTTIRRGGGSALEKANIPRILLVCRRIRGSSALYYLFLWVFL
jgi:hypothetical protein